MNKHTRIKRNDHPHNDNPDAKWSTLRNAIQEGLDSGPTEPFDFDEFVSSKESEC